MKFKLYLLIFFCSFFVQNAQAQTQEKNWGFGAAVSFAPQGEIYLGKELLEDESRLAFLPLTYVQGKILLNGFSVIPYFEFYYKSLGLELGYEFDKFKPIIYWQQDMVGEMEKFIGMGLTYEILQWTKLKEEDHRNIVFGFVLEGFFDVGIVPELPKEPSIFVGLNFNLIFEQKDKVQQR